MTRLPLKNRELSNDRLAINSAPDDDTDCAVVTDAMVSGGVLDEPRQGDTNYFSRGGDVVAQWI